MKNDQLLGSIIDDDGVASVRVADVYDATAEELWATITRPERLANWLAVVEGDLQVGSHFHAVFTSGWEGMGRIDACEPPRRLQLTMNPDADEESTVNATLEARGDRTRLVIEERGLPLAQAPGFAAGWQVHFEDLAATITGETSGDWRSRWAELSKPYDELATRP